ncbi:methytransferase partner Trm112 [Chloroflexota bacterium]
MKKVLMEILACPVCKGPLGLDIAEEDENEVTKGTLSCTSCSHQYPIEDGIPDLLPPNLSD